MKLTGKVFVHHSGQVHHEHGDIEVVVDKNEQPIYVKVLTDKVIIIPWSMVLWIEGSEDC